MNAVIQTILNRRSVRSYKPDPLPDAVLQDIVRCGVWAPSSRNLQARHILVLTRAADIARLQQALVASSALPGYDHYKAFVSAPSYSITFGAAPVFAVVGADPSRTRCPDADAALALGNMFLAAAAHGVGSCWVNQLGPVCNEPGTRAVLRELGLPDTQRVYGAACFGYPDGPLPEPPARKDNLVTIVE